MLNFLLQLHRKTNLRLLMTVLAFEFLKIVTYLFPKLNTSDYKLSPHCH